MNYPKDTIEFAPLPKDKRFHDITEQVFNDLLILGFAGYSATPSDHPKLLWFVECHCGNVFVAIGSNIKNGNTKSCGCIGRQRMTLLRQSHALSYSREHRIWSGIKTRCYNSRSRNYVRYGGRGIRMCERWRHSFEHFFADMGEAPSAVHSIERRNNNGDYTPENCYWGTRLIQSNNRRNNVFLTFGNKTQSIADWARETGLSYATLQQRIYKEWDVADALTVPPQKSRYWSVEP